MKNEDVKLNPMFRNLLPPHSSMVWDLIYEDIKEKRKVPPLITWNSVLVDGYVRYDICKELGIPFECTEMEFASEDEAKFFKIKNQLLQRQITVFQRCEIIYPFTEFLDDTNDVDEFEDEAVIVSEEQDKARSESMNSTAMQTEEGNSAESDYADRTIDATDSRDTTEDFDTEASEVIDDTELAELAELASDEDMHSGD